MPKSAETTLLECDLVDARARWCFGGAPALGAQALVALEAHVPCESLGGTGMPGMRGARFSDPLAVGSDGAETLSWLGRSAQDSMTLAVAPG